MTSLVVPGLDTLRQWLDDLGMSFFECDNCQARICPICRISTVSLMPKSI